MQRVYAMCFSYHSLWSDCLWAPCIKIVIFIAITITIAIAIAIAIIVCPWSITAFSLRCRVQSKKSPVGPYRCHHFKGQNQAWSWGFFTDLSDVPSISRWSLFLSWKVYNFVGCLFPLYLGETTRHICTCVCEHLSADKSLHVYRHLQSSRACHDSCATECFTTSDSATSKFQIKIKEALHIKWENPILNLQLKLLDLPLSF